MDIIVAFFSISIGLFALGILTKSGKKRDALKRRKEELGETTLDNRTQELNKPLKERLWIPIWNKILSLLSNTKLQSKDNSKSILRKERLLQQAGISISGVGFQQLQRVIAFVGILIGILLGILFGRTILIGILFMLIGLILSILLPNYYVKAKAKQRRAEIQQSLPDVMDMLSICVEAGLGLDGAILKIGEKNKGPLTEEMIKTIKEIQLGRLRRDAFKDLGDKNDIIALKTFTAAIIQGEKYGIPIKGILKVQAAKLRESRKQTAQEKAMKAPVKIMIPIVIFIFPVIFIILMGPSVVNIMDMML